MGKPRMNPGAKKQGVNSPTDYSSESMTPRMPADTWLETIAEPELVHPESNAPKSTRPSGNGDLVFTEQDTGTLVLL
jgi:hypothetical protein